MRRSRLALTGFIVLFVAGCSSSATTAPSASTGPSPVVSIAPSTVPASVAPSSPAPTDSTPASTPSDWAPVPDQPAASQTQLFDVVWTGSRFVAAGVDANNAAVFVDSTDGLAWNLQPPLAADAQVRGLTSSPAGIVAVGARGSAASSWFSKDGLTWTASQSAASLKPAPGTTIGMNGVTASGSGWLAVGEEDTACELNCDSAQSVRAIVWSSADGLTWSRRPTSSSLAHAAMNGVVQAGPGFVAVGAAPDRVTTSQVPEHGVVWTSTDGRSWSRVADAPLFHAPSGTDQTFGDSIKAVATDGTHLVAVGTVGTQGDVGSALAWSSSDGRTWKRGTAVDFAYGQMFNVAAVPNGFLGIGPSGTDSCVGGIWSSADGDTWTCVATDLSMGGFAAYAAAASPTLTVVVGLPTPDVSIQSSIWTRPTP